jgi:hypothetical protein
MTDYIAELAQHVPFIMLITALLLGAVIGLAARSKIVMIGAMLRYLMLLSIGVTCIWEFVLHAFFPASSASMLGVCPHTFQFEVAMANLGIACAALWAFKAGFDAWVAVAIMITCFSAGTAVMFLWQVIMQNVSHAGHFFYADILTVFVVDVLLGYYHALNHNK